MKPLINTDEQEFLKVKNSLILAVYNSVSDRWQSMPIGD